MLSEQPRASTPCRQLEFILDRTREFITLINRDYVYELVNASYCLAMGKRQDEVVGRSVSEIWGHERFESTIRPHLETCFEGNKVGYIERFRFGAENRYMQVEFHPYRDDDQRITHALVFIGIENLQQISRLHGYDIGDLILENTGTRIKEVVRQSDHVFRFEGNEIAVILSRLGNRADVAGVSTKILDEVAPPYRLHGPDIVFACRAGAAIYPDDGATPEELVKSAAEALADAGRCLRVLSRRAWPTRLADRVDERTVSFGQRAEPRSTQRSPRAGPPRQCRGV